MFYQELEKKIKAIGFQFDLDTKTGSFVEFEQETPEHGRLCLIASQGMICSIVKTTQSHDLSELKAKSAGFVWEFMFTRSMYKAEDRSKQHELLNSVADPVDAGKVKTTLGEILGPMSVENIWGGAQTTGGEFRSIFFVE